jgi:Photosynthetic reaction centre cytochrome C subunit
VIGRDRSGVFVFGFTIAFALGITARAHQTPAQQPSAQQPPAGAGAPAQPPGPPPGAQQPRRPPRPGEKAAEYYKNIKILKDLPAEQLPITMQFIAASLGVGCDFCHVTGPQGGFDRDEKKPKETARKMLQMVGAINTQQFEGRTQINCTTCHHGNHRPDRNTVLAVEMTPGEAAAAQRAGGERQGGPGRSGSGPSGAPAASSPSSATGSPGAASGLGRGSQGEPDEPPPPAESVDQVLDKYVQVLGGEAALARAKTRVMRGTATGRDLQTAPITVQEKVTGEYRIDTQGRQGAQSRVFDGKSAWVQMPNGIRDAEGFNAQQIRRLADLGLPLNAKQRYQNLRSARYGAIDGAPTVVLIGSPATDVVEHLEFDRATGLLLRRSVFTRTPLGQLQERFDYSDYREVSGIKMPYQVRHATWNNVTTEKFSDITVNAPIDEAQFAKPPSRQ